MKNLTGNLFWTCLYYFIIFYIDRAISTQTKKKVSGSIKNMPYVGATVV